MLLLGIDLGTSSIKVSVVDAATGNCLASAQYPETEVDIVSLQPGWAEQSPDLWWTHTVQAILACHAAGSYDPADIAAIGISYQMHGLVLVDRDQRVLRDAIIWCDGRAVPIGERAFEQMGESYCLSHLLNSPGNFTASKLSWVREQEPAVYERVHKFLLPGDFIAMKLTGEITTTVSALSEGMFWDFRENCVSRTLMDHFGFESSLIPQVTPLFGSHGSISPNAASMLSLRPGTAVSYKAGDQLNNAFSLHVLQPGEVAATAGTSGVIYGVSDELTSDPRSRINSFAHVNHQPDHHRVGVLLCINGAGIFNRWVRNVAGSHKSYEQVNEEAARIPVGAQGLFTLPFGNGPERMLENRTVGSHLHNIDFNIHTAAHVARAAQEGIAFAFRYGLDIMRENGMHPSIIRAGRANMFLSEVFQQSFVNATGVPVELHTTDGSVGAALGAGVGAGIYAGADEAFAQRKHLQLIEPTRTKDYDPLYQEWKQLLEAQLETTTT
ncbi:MAG: carbohydrate kinase [Flaviaesturariibacter sp.]|nr:carbohydrate kinase [Flaviaesturariibacter sp.]